MLLDEQNIENAIELVTIDDGIFEIKEKMDSVVVASEGKSNWKKELAKYEIGSVWLKFYLSIKEDNKQILKAIIWEKKRRKLQENVSMKSWVLQKNITLQTCLKTNPMKILRFQT
ncbi:hypothetical protein [Methanobrevibacter sp.]